MDRVGVHCRTRAAVHRSAHGQGCGLVNEGLVMVASPPAELDRYFREEDRWRKVIQDARIKAD